jgi:hypothetical protein
MALYLIRVSKGKAIPVGDREGPLGYETSRLPHFLGNRLTDGGEAVSLTRRPSFKPPEIFLVLISVRGWDDPMVIVRLEGIDKVKKLNDLIGNRIRDLPACSIMPQPNTLPCAPIKHSHNFIFTTWHWQFRSEMCVYSMIVQKFLFLSFEEWNTRSCPEFFLRAVYVGEKKTERILIIREKSTECLVGDLN